MIDEKWLTLEPDAVELIERLRAELAALKWVLRLLGDGEFHKPKTEETIDLVLLLHKPKKEIEK